MLSCKLPTFSLASQVSNFASKISFRALHSFIHSFHSHFLFGLGRCCCRFFGCTRNRRDMNQKFIFSRWCDSHMAALHVGKRHRTNLQTLSIEIWNAFYVVYQHLLRRPFLPPHETGKLAIFDFKFNIKHIRANERASVWRVMHEFIRLDAEREKTSPRKKKRTSRFSISPHTSSRNVREWNGRRKQKNYFNLERLFLAFTITCWPPSAASTITILEISSRHDNRNFYAVLREFQSRWNCFSLFTEN